MDQELIFNQVLKDLFSDGCTATIDEKRVNKLLKKSNVRTCTISLENIFFSQNIASASFCFAYSGLQIISNREIISSRGYFEILFFNCVVAFEKMKVDKEDPLWGELINLLIFYLENQNLVNQIKNIDQLLNHRLTLYSEQLQLIKTTPDYDYKLLNYYFFVKPLSLKPKIKLKEIRNRNFSTLMLFMITDIEEKLFIMQKLVR